MRILRSSADDDPRNRSVAGLITTLFPELKLAARVVRESCRIMISRRCFWGLALLALLATAALVVPTEAKKYAGHAHRQALRVEISGGQPAGGLRRLRLR
jgi:hypothetical protein